MLVARKKLLLIQNEIVICQRKRVENIVQIPRTPFQAKSIGIIQLHFAVFAITGDRVVVRRLSTPPVRPPDRPLVVGYHSLWASGENSIKLHNPKITDYVTLRTFSIINYNGKPIEPSSIIGNQYWLKLVQNFAVFSCCTNTITDYRKTCSPKPTHTVAIRYVDSKLILN